MFQYKQTNKQTNKNLVEKHSIVLPRAGDLCIPNHADVCGSDDVVHELSRGHPPATAFATLCCLPTYFASFGPPLTLVGTRWRCGSRIDCLQTR